MTKKQKLELTWIGKDARPKLEPRILLEDPAKKEALFTTMAKAWFPDGPTDPNLGLLAVSVLRAEYWDVDDSKMVQLFKMAKAAVTGKTPDLGEHKKVAVS